MIVNYEVENQPVDAAGTLLDQMIEHGYRNSPEVEEFGGYVCWSLTGRETTTGSSAWQAIIDVSNDDEDEALAVVDAIHLCGRSALPAAAIFRRVS